MCRSECAGVCAGVSVYNCVYVRWTCAEFRECVILTFFIYETFLHIPRLPLQTSNKEAPSPTTSTTKRKTYSLFTALPSDRTTCETANIPRKFCVCEPTYTFVVLLMVLPGVLVVWWLYSWCVKKKPKRTIYVNNMQFR